MPACHIHLFCEALASNSGEPQREPQICIFAHFRCVVKVVNFPMNQYLSVPFYDSKQLSLWTFAVENIFTGSIFFTGDFSPFFFFFK